MDRHTVFISHITEEAELALRLKRLLRRHFLGAFDVFDSSDNESLEAGKDWLRDTTKALRSTRIQLILSSAVSIKRPWVNFEAGAAWIQGVALVPVCHSGLKCDSRGLPLPYSTLFGIEADSIDGW